VRAHLQGYLAERTTSRSHLRRLLLQRARRSVQACTAAAIDAPDTEQVAGWVDAALDHATQLRLVDDARYAEDKARSLSRRGVSTMGIRARLAAKGVLGANADEALDSLGDRAMLDLAAAQALARRRRLGPWRPAEARKDLRTKDLAVLGRAGFGYELARRVIDGELDEEV
jgi:regulatory protein